MIELSFGNNLFDAVICLFGKLPKKRFFKHFEDCPILAADGAGVKLLKKGISPDYIIGDLDSFHNKPISKKFDKSKIILIEDQETNDFEKNLIFAKESGYRNIVILGFHGGELEHSLNNWSVFMRYSKVMNLCIYDEDRYGIAIRESIRFSTEDNEMISIIPQTRTKIITKNLKWALNNEVLEFGEREGARNIAIGKDVQIELIEGEYLLFINSRLPYAPLFNEF
jgi:thiamine pyrophosphokinase